METQRVREELMEVVQSLSPDRQEQLLHWARSLAKPNRQLPSSSATGALVEKDGFLVVRSKLEGPLVDHRQIREEYLDKILEPKG
jgi:hypothetical protein